jgi:hypothetical protein
LLQDPHEHTAIQEPRICPTFAAACGHEARCLPSVELTADLVPKEAIRQRSWPHAEISEARCCYMSPSMSVSRRFFFITAVQQHAHNLHGHACDLKFFLFLTLLKNYF